MTHGALNLWTNSRRLSGLLDGVRERVAPAPSATDVASFVDPDPVRWIQTHFYIPETRSPLALAPYQEWTLRRALTPDPITGLYPYSIIVWGDIKKSIKSCIAGGVMLWWMFQDDWRSGYAVANDLKQADSRVGYYMRRAIQLNPKLRSACRVLRNKIQFPNHSFIEMVPIDPTGEAGSNADMTVFSELWGAHQEAQQRMWTEMTIPPNKFGRAWRWVETYAGYEGESLLLEQLYGQAVKPEQRVHDDYEVYEHASSRTLCLWNTRPRLAWQTPEYYAQQEGELLPDEFRRVHLNQWSSGSNERFLDDQSWWTACQEPLPPLGQREPLVLAADGAKSNDHLALVGVTRHPDPNRPRHVAVRYVRAWPPPKGGKHDLRVLGEAIRDLVLRYHVVLVTYDEYQLHLLMMELSESGVVWCDEFSQSKEREIADKQLYDLIVHRQLAHDGDDVLTQAVKNANREVNGKDKNRMRIVKRADELKIDPLVCASMAAARCLELNL